jgi:GNAT superfamily N-acetyltransferase
MVDDSAGIRRATADDVAGLPVMLAEALHEDDIFAWAFPDEDRRPTLLRSVIEVFVGIAASDGLLWVTEDLASAAVWSIGGVPGSTRPNQQDQAALDLASGPYQDRWAVLRSRLELAHPEGPAHTALRMIGTRPERRSQGWGGSLIEHRLAELDRSGTPAYLTASSKRGLALYRSVGFEYLGAPQDLPQGPRLYPMWRRPKADPAGRR